MKTCTNACQICGLGTLHLKTLANEVEYKGQHRDLKMRVSTCNTCCVEQATATDALANKRAMMAFKKEVDGLLSGIQIRALRERLGISQAEAAQIFGGGPVAFSKYENNDVAQSDAMNKLLRVSDSIPSAFEWLAEAAGRADIATRITVHRFEKWVSSFEHQLPKQQYESVKQIGTVISNTITLQQSANDQEFNDLQVVGA